MASLGGKTGKDVRRLELQSNSLRLGGKGGNSTSFAFPQESISKQDGNTSGKCTNGLNVQTSSTRLSGNWTNESRLLSSQRKTSKHKGNCGKFVSILSLQSRMRTFEGMGGKWRKFNPERLSVPVMRERESAS